MCLDIAGLKELPWSEWTLEINPNPGILLQARGTAFRSVFLLKGKDPRATGTAWRVVHPARESAGEWRRAVRQTRNSRSHRQGCSEAKAGVRRWC